MGKKRVGTLYNKPVVEGDPNLITKNEIHVKKSKDTISMQERDNSGGLSPITAGGNDLLYYKVKSVPLTVTWKGEKHTFDTNKEIYDNLADLIFPIIFPIEIIYNGERCAAITNLGHSGTDKPITMSLPYSIISLENLLGDHESLSFCIKATSAVMVGRSFETQNMTKINLNGDLQQQVFQVAMSLEDDISEISEIFKFLLETFFEPITKQEYEQQIIK